MASEQMRRENVSDERNIEVEKDRVPKMTTHFESLAREQKDDVPVRVAGIEYHSGETQSESEMKKSDDQAEKMGSQIRTVREEEKQGPSLDEISNLRATAQQQSMEAIRAAEDRYNKAKEVGILQKPEESNKDTTMEKGQQAKEGKDVISSKGGASKDTTMEKGQQAKDYTAEKATEGKDVISSKGRALKDTTMETGQQAKDYTAEKAKEGKDVISSKGGALIEKTKQAKDYTAQKVVEAKDVISSQGQSAAQYAAEKGKVAKDNVVDTAVTAAGYVENKAVAAKDVTVETGKKVGSQAVVAGWGAAHYTLEKVAEATKAVAGVTSGVAGYAKDAVVSAEEKAAEYAARKRAEAKEGLEVHKSSHEKGETLVSKEQHETRDVVPEKTEQAFEQEQRREQGGVFQAIGETIVEIGQTTTELLAGQKHTQR